MPGLRERGVVRAPPTPTLSSIILFVFITSGQNPNKINFEAWEHCPDVKLCSSCAQLHDEDALRDLLPDSPFH